MMRSSRMGGGRILHAASQVVSGKEPFSIGAGSSSSARVGGADMRAVIPPPAAAATSPTFGGGGGGAAVAWNDWETVNADVEREEEELPEFWYLDTVPPRSDEVEAAIWSLQQMSIPSSYPQERYSVENDDDEHSNSGTAEREINSVLKTSASTEPESDWIEPSFHACGEISAANNCQKALEAFHLLKVNPSIQKMVFSLSSDKAVWDAVMKNEAVQEIKKSLCEAGSADPKTSDNRSPVESIVSALGSVYSSTKTTVMELIEKMTTFVNNLVHSSENKGDKESEFFADAVKSSLMLSVFVFLIVIVGRLQK